MKVIQSKEHIYTFAPNLVPAGNISPGESLCYSALDAWGGQIRDETDTLSKLDFTRVDPATGPVRIESARPGDTVLVRVASIEMEDQGAIVTGPSLGILADEIKNHATRILPIRDGFVQFGDLQVPIAPTIGVIGVAPEFNSFSTGTAHRHGGNMDTKEIGLGATVYLPVFQEGAMLAMGDVRAVMGMVRPACRRAKSLHESPSSGSN